MLGFGLVCTFFSSFGQTFLISLFVPAIQNRFDLSLTAFGMIYIRRNSLQRHCFDSGRPRPRSGKGPTLYDADSASTICIVATTCLRRSFDFVVSCPGWIAPVYLACFGFAIGLSSTIKAALSAEQYPISMLASIRSVFLSMMTLSTALSPAIFGWLLDRGIDFARISQVVLLCTVPLILWTFRL